MSTYFLKSKVIKNIILTFCILLIVVLLGYFFIFKNILKNYRNANGSLTKTTPITKDDIGQYYTRQTNPKKDMTVYTYERGSKEKIKEYIGLGSIDIDWYKNKIIVDNSTTVLKPIFGDIISWCTKEAMESSSTSMDYITAHMGYCHTPLFEVGTIKSPSVFANEKLYQIYLPYFYKKSVGEVEFTKTTSYNKHYFVKKGDQFIFVLQEKSFDEKMFDSINHTYSKEIHYTTLPLRGNNISFTRFDFKKEIDEYPKTLVLTSPNYTLKLSGFAEEYVDRDGYYYQIKNITSNDIYNTGNIYPTDYAPCFPTVNKCKNVKSKTSFLTNEKAYYNHVVGKIYNIDGLFYLLKDNGNIFIYEKYPSFLLQKEYSSFTLGGDIVLQEDDCYNFKIGANVATNTKWFNENELIKYKTVTTTTSTIKFDLYTFKYPEKNEYVKTLYNIYTKGICKNKTVNTNTFTTVSTTFNDFLYCPMSIGMGNETMNTCTIGDKVLFWKDDQRDWRVYINRQSLGLRY